MLGLKPPTFWGESGDSRRHDRPNGRVGLRFGQRRIMDLWAALAVPGEPLVAARRKQHAEEGLPDVLNPIQQRFWTFDD
jgi:hypothetical protein